MQLLTSSALSATAAVLAFASAISAQPASAPALPAHNMVTIVHVKPDMLTEWIDLQKNEVIPAQKKGDLITRTTYRTRFGNTYEFAIVIPFEKYATFDGQAPVVRALGAEGAARLGAKLRRCIDGSQTFVSSAVPDLSNSPDGEMPAIGVYTRVRVAPGRMQEYQNFLKNEVLPLYKKTNTRYVVNRRGLGANTNDLTQITMVGGKYADLDAGSPLTRVLGTDGAAKLMAKTAGMATLVEQVVRVRVPELSY